MTITRKVQEKIDSQNITKTWLSDFLGVTRVTLDARLQKGNWKKGELVLLQKVI